MKRHTTSAFTLIEMLTVMAVIAILASLIVAVNAFAHKKAALLRADGEIKSMASACENYKADFGSYPRDTESGSDTDSLDPRTDGNPTTSSYEKANIVLYKTLSGDAKQGTDATTPAVKTDVPDGKPETKGYFDFRPDQLRRTTSGDIRFIQDPFGNPYGFSTAGAAAEEKFREKVQTDPSVQRTLKGFSPNFDLWSTGGVISKNTGDALNLDRKRWVKNW